MMELHEIVAIICQHPDVWSADAVIAPDAPGNRVILHVVPKTATSLSPRDVNCFLIERLPAYMVPAAIAVHEQLPTTGSGQIDYITLRSARLAAGADENSVEGCTDVPNCSRPRDKIEFKLAALFSDLLRLRQVDVRRSFFDLGGHSLLAVKLFARIENEFHQRLPLATLLCDPSVRKLAERLRRTQEGIARWSCLVPIQTEGCGPKFYCVHGAGGNVLLYRDLARRMAPAVRFYGLQAQGLDGQSECLTRIEDMAGLYLEEILLEQPQGPYFLGGYCMGGNIAYEIARLLQQKGLSVGLVAMLDTYNLRKSTYDGSLVDRAHIWLQKGCFHVDTLARLSMADRKVYVAEKLRMVRELIQGIWLATLRTHKPDGSPDDPSASDVAFVQSANHVALKAHNPQPLAGNLVLFRPSKNYFSFPDPNMGWHELVTGRLESVSVATNPHSMLIEPFVQRLAGELSRRILEENAHP
jgi:thioesterase domain-containing protein